MISHAAAPVLLFAFGLLCAISTRTKVIFQTPETAYSWRLSLPIPGLLFHHLQKIITCISSGWHCKHSLVKLSFCKCSLWHLEVQHCRDSLCRVNPTAPAGLHLHLQLQLQLWFLIKTKHTWRKEWGNAPLKPSWQLWHGHSFVSSDVKHDLFYFI